MNAYMNFLVNVYIPSNIEWAFRKHLFLQNTFYRMVLTFGCCFLYGQSKMSQEENVYYESNEYLQRSLWEENISKRSDKFNIWFQSKISWVEIVRNNGLNVNNKNLCCVTQTGREVQNSQFLVLYNNVVTTLGFGYFLVVTLDNVVTTLSQHCHKVVFTCRYYDQKLTLLERCVFDAGFWPAIKVAATSWFSSRFPDGNLKVLQ